jgi:hypothetical protein
MVANLQPVFLLIQIDSFFPCSTRVGCQSGIIREETPFYSYAEITSITAYRAKF